MSAICLWAILVFINLIFVGKVFAYEYDFSIDIVNTLLAIMGTIWVSWLLSLFSVREAQPSRYVVCLIATFLMIPFCSVFAVTSMPIWNLLYVLISFSIVCILVGAKERIIIPSLRYEFISIFILISIGVTAYVYTSLIVIGGLERLSLDLNEVYTARREYLDIRFWLSPYLVPWQANVLNMTLLTIGLYERKKAWIVISISAQVLLFALTNFKSFLFGPLLVLFVVKFVSSKRLFLYLSAGSSGAIAFFYGYYLASGKVLLPAIFIRRLYVVPSVLHSYYFDFFSHNPKVMLSNSIFSWLIDYPYSLPITRVISWEYFNSDFGPNVGYVGDAYAHFGFWGVLVFSVGLALLLKVIDSLSQDVPVPVVAGVIALPVMALINSAFLTTLLTHGLLLSTLLVWCLRAVYKRRELNISRLTRHRTQVTVA